jgi:phage shock protein A
MAKVSIGREIKRTWKYLAMKLHLYREKHADPKVQLEQAIEEVKEQHRALTEKAAAVIANQKQVQSRLDRMLADYDKANRTAGQALLLADQAALADPAQAERFNGAAHASGAKVLQLRADIEQQQQLVLVATSQAQEAQAAVVQSRRLLEQKLKERERLLSELERAQMHEAMVQAMKILTDTVGDGDVPTFAEVERKIQTRLHNAESMSELLAAQASLTIDPRVLEVEKTQEDIEVQALLAQKRAELGLSAPKAIPAPMPAAIPAAAPVRDELATRRLEAPREDAG